jgi:hypothetical protein
MQEMIAAVEFKTFYFPISPLRGLKITAYKTVINIK